MLLVTECKSEVRDVGQVERTQNWYEREAMTAARRFGWRAVGVSSMLVLLASEDNDRTTGRLRAVFGRLFPVRGRDLSAAIESGEVSAGARGLAMIDPRSRRRQWLRPLRIDGRRTPAPYQDYLDCLRVLGG
jgi:hypothetical protein